MALYAASTIDTTGILLKGEAYFTDDETLEQDAARATALAPYTVLAKEASTGKLVPLSDADPAVTSAKLVCGALGCTIPELALISDGEFGLTVDGELISITDLDFTGLDAEDDTAGYFTCGTNGAIIAAGWDAITDGSITVTVNGVAVVLTGLDFTDCTTFWEVADTVNYAAAGRFTVEYNGDANVYRFVSNTTGETSRVSAIATGGVGTDISAAGYFNAPGGTATAGTGGEGTLQTPAGIINAAAAGQFYAAYNGDAMVFWSPTQGLPASSITALSDQTAGGTYIGGASYINGETGTGVITAATGGDGEDIPMGIFWSDSVTAAALVAADVTNRKVCVGGGPVVLDQDKIVLEGSLTLASVVTSTGKTIEQHLRELGIFTKDTYTNGQVAPV